MSRQELPRPPSGFLSTSAIDPRSGAVSAAYVPVRRATFLANFGPMHKFHELLTLVRDTLRTPDCCFPYLADELRGYGFTLRARYSVRNDGRRVRPPVGCVFVVFLTESMKVTDWGWEQEDGSRPGWARLREGRLGDPLWCKERR